jgi:hypothetical protein
LTASDRSWSRGRQRVAHLICGQGPSLRPEQWLRSGWLGGGVGCRREPVLREPAGGPLDLSIRRMFK